MRQLSRAHRTTKPHPVSPTETLKRGTEELYGLLGALGERLFLEALSLCDTEKEAAAWASADLVRSLEQRRLLHRVAHAP